MSDYTPETTPSIRSNSVDSLPAKRRGCPSKSLTPKEQEAKVSKGLYLNRLAARKYRAKKSLGLNMKLNKAEARSDYLEMVLRNTTNELEQLKRILCYECREIHFHQGLRLEQDIEKERARQRRLLIQQNTDGQGGSSYGCDHSEGFKIEHISSGFEDQNIDPSLMLDDVESYIWVPRPV